MAGRAREGSVYQRHDHPTCPPPDADGNRPPHRCRGRWVATVDLGRINGRRRRPVAYAATEREALTALKRMVAEKDSGRLGEDATMAQWCAYWLDVIEPERARPAAIANHRSHITHWILPAIGRVRLSQLRPADVRRVRTLMETSGRLDAAGRPTHVPHSPSTVRAVLVTLDAILGAAVRERRITWNPADAVDKPSPSDRHAAKLSAVDARRVIDAALDPEEQARHAVALLAGLRQGEALGLQWDDIDLDAGLLHVRRTAYPLRDGSGGMAVKDGAKTSHSVRSVPLHAALATALANWRVDAPGPYVFGGASPTPAGRDYRRWKDACARAGVPLVPLHGARGTCASMLREAGVPLSTIGAILGHRPGSPITGLAYAEAREPELRAAIDRL